MTAFVAGCASDETGDGDGPLDGQWVLSGRVVNEDDEPREWRVESRSEGRESFVAASGTVPANGEHELELSGLLHDEQREVYAKSDDGAVSEPWRPTDCRRLFAEVSISNGTPRWEPDCREE